MSNKTRIIAIIIALIIAFMLGWCSRKNDTKIINVPVKVPAKSGSFESPKILVPIDTKEVSKIILKDTTIYIPTVNEDLLDEYLKTKEERDKLLLYADAIKINNYETKFDNKDISLTIKSKTEGKLLEIKPEYTIKEQELNIPVKVPITRDNFGFLIGGKYNQNLDTRKANYELDAGFRIGKVNIITSVNTNKDIGLGAIIEF